jgi:hypothetical protein
MAIEARVPATRGAASAVKRRSPNGMWPNSPAIPVALLTTHNGVDMPGATCVAKDLAAIDVVAVADQLSVAISVAADCTRADASVFRLGRNGRRQLQ